MSVETELYTRLSGYTTLTNLTSTRQHPNVLPENETMPAISWRRVSDQRVSAMGADVVNVRARFQIDCWASTYTSMRAVADAVRGALQRYSNLSTGGVIEDTYFLNQTEFYENDTGIHHAALDFEINYRE